jgi:hypothetical protein
MRKLKNEIEMKRTELSGRIEYKLNGKLHREDGPAMELVDGKKKWYRTGILHREDGPAVELPDGTKGWYIDGVRVSTFENK